MKKACVGFFAGFFLLMAADTKPQATYITKADVQATLKKAAPDSATDTQVRVVDVGKANVGVGVVYRSAKAAQAAVAHDDVTEVYEILEGSGTLMTGGEVVAAGGKQVAHDAKGPSGPSSRGTALRGAESRHVGPGDLIIIPPGVGHVFSKFDTPTIEYVVVRVDPDKVLPAK